MHVNWLGNIEPKFKILYRVEIPRSKFTYVEAVDKIIQLNDIWDFDYIAVDRGYGKINLPFYIGIYKIISEGNQRKLSRKIS